MGADESPLRRGMAGARRGWHRFVGAITRNRLRILFALLLVVSLGVIVAGAMSQDLSTASKDAAPEASPADNVTVITESGRAGTIIAYDTDGSILYYENERTKYFDVDEVAGEPMTVEYVATDTLHTEGPRCSDPPCARNVLERVDLETGEVEVLFTRYNHQETAGEWHDHVRVNETHVLIADILYDQVYMVNLETGIVEWLWDAQSDFDVAEDGGDFPRDWTHLNDVSLLEDGRIMASLRNFDRVVFIEPGSGVDHDWTLGRENDYDILYEQHNPDYIPEERGGPAVVLADSENGRIQEFQRENGEWNRTWVWSDDQLQWPRDADRLPNGNTLVTDTHGKRVMEVAPNGSIVWEVPSTLPYEAERLGTGPESTGGSSATELALRSRTSEEGIAGSASWNPFQTLSDIVHSIIPHRWTNAVYFVAPVWFGDPQFGAALVIVFTVLAWVGLELRWFLFDAGIRFRLPVHRPGSEE